MAERRIDLSQVPRFGKTSMVMEHIKAAMCGGKKTGGKRPPKK